VADGEKGFLGKRRIQTIETLTKEKGHSLAFGQGRVAWARLERRGRALNVQVVRVVYPLYI